MTDVFTDFVSGETLTADALNTALQSIQTLAQTALATAETATGIAIPLSSLTISVPADYTTATAALAHIANRSLSGPIQISVSGVIDEPAALNLSHPYGSQVTISGANSFSPTVTAMHYTGDGTTNTVTVTISGTRQMAVGNHIRLMGVYNTSYAAIPGLGGLFPITAVDSTGLIATISIPGIIAAFATVGGVNSAVVYTDALLFPSGPNYINATGPSGMTIGGLALAPQSGASVSNAISLKSSSLTVSGLAIADFGGWAVYLTSSSIVGTVSAGCDASVSNTGGLILLGDAGCSATLVTTVCNNLQNVVDAVGGWANLAASEYNFISAVGGAEDGAYVDVSGSWIWGAGMPRHPYTSGAGSSPALSAFNGSRAIASSLNGGGSTWATPTFSPTPNTLSADGSFIVT